MPRRSLSARSEAPAALRAGELGTADVTASTVANIGPGIDFYFGFGVVAATAGVAAPLTILAAGIATLLLAFVVSEFTRAEPSAGSFITYVESAFGPRLGVLTAALVAVGYTIAIAAVFTMSGGVVALILGHYASWEPPWEPLTLVFTGGAIWLAAQGVRISTRVVGVSVLVQVLVMVAVCAVVLVDERAVLSSTPFQWSHVSGGLAGLSGGFPLAIYMFIGWENGPALAEEAREPRRTIPRAVNIAVVATTALFVLFAYATVTGFHYDVSSVGRSSIPFLSVAESYTGDAALVAWLVGAVSVFATLIAAVNAQSRMLFDAGRSGLLPRWLGRLRRGADTPVNALLTMAGAGLSIIAVWWLAHATGVATGSTDPVGLYAECSTMGTIVIFVVYALTAAALPVFIWRRHRGAFSAVRHVVVPALGALAIAIPFVELCRPGQPYPYNVFPFLALAIVALAAIYAALTLRRDPTAGAGETARFED
ncbi:MAG TPA: APC family permease [Solirubrobacteraceae bacterium]|nr:APC family permease [Solirubrobacteraceae bacterium]